jgi:hypothetical protein
VPAAPFGEPRLAASWLEGQKAGPVGTDDEDDTEEDEVADVEDEEEDVEVEPDGAEVVVVAVADLREDEQPATATATVSARRTAALFIEPPKIAACLPHPRSGTPDGCSASGTAVPIDTSHLRFRW